MKKQPERIKSDARVVVLLSLENETGDGVEIGGLSISGGETWPDLLNGLQMHTAALLEAAVDDLSEEDFRRYFV